MYLVRLVYVSTISDRFSEKDIVNILHVARQKNESQHVTGLLCFNNKYFLQCLEGSRCSVNATYHRILNDPRHVNIVMLDYREIINREFLNWSMGYVPSLEITREVNMMYSGTPDFSPYDMFGESAHQMMLTLKETVRMV